MGGSVGRAEEAAPQGLQPPPTRHSEPGRARHMGKGGSGSTERKDM